MGLTRLFLPTRGDDSGMSPKPYAAGMSSPLFAAESSVFLIEQYLPRIRAAFQLLPAEDRWWTPHRDALSFGAILRHLEGNVRQWIVAGVGGAPDLRERRLEFAAPKEDCELLLIRLEATCEAAARVIEEHAERLEERRFIQGESCTVLHAIYHVVEHFSWHLGQAIWIAKARAGAGHGFALYDEEAINRARNDSRD